MSHSESEMPNQNNIEKVLIEYLAETTKEINKKAANGEGKEILGEVINRPDDVDIGIDKVGEEILERLLKKYGIGATIFSEPESRDIKNGHNIYGSIDPFDGSILFLNGLRQNWYTALSFYEKDRTPICTGISDILNEKFYISTSAGNYLLGKENDITKIARSNRKKITEPIILASYLMSSLYSKKFLDIFGDLIKNLHPKALFYPQGGSFIYAFLAAGLVDAYVMFDEPRSEIDPGYPMAKRAGCSIVSVNSDGSYQDYEFLPSRQHDKVDLLVASATSEIRDEIIKIYVKKYAEKYSFGV
ncbi:MAG: hypothetical protein V1705_00515 [bacterium]